MSEYILSCGSPADLSSAHLEKRGIKALCFHYNLNGKNYDDDFGKSMSHDDFYKAMEAGASTQTSQINVDEFEKYFAKFLEEGYDVLHVSLSSGISGEVNSAKAAAKEMAARYPNNKVYVVDSLGASSGYGLFMETLADLRDGGMTVDELYNWAMANRLRLHHWFFSTTLEYYVRGGRISKASGWFGTVLKICPLLNMDNLGRLIPRYKIRGKEKVISETVNKMAEHAENGTDYSGKCFISHSYCLEDAKKVAELVEKRFPKLNGRVLINNIGMTIGSHTGPGTVALFFWGDERVD